MRNNLSSHWNAMCHGQCFGQRESALVFSGFVLPALGGFLQKSFPSNALGIAGSYGVESCGETKMVVIVFKAWLCLIFPFKSEFWDSQISIWRERWLWKSSGWLSKIGDKQRGSKKKVGSVISSVFQALYWETPLLLYGTGLKVFLSVWKLGSFWTHGQPYLHHFLLFLHILLLSVIFPHVGIIPEIHRSPFVLSFLLQLLFHSEVPPSFANP